MNVPSTSFDGISPESAGSGDSSNKPDLQQQQQQQQLDGPPKKRARKRRDTGDNKHLCPEPGCGKSFSRPDHLSRHRLNHNPTTTYHCSHADCEKTFVRLDLLVRHEERHERKLDPEKAAAHKARQQAAQARAVPVQPKAPPPTSSGNDAVPAPPFALGVGQVAADGGFAQSSYGIGAAFPPGSYPAASPAFPAFNTPHSILPSQQQQQIPLFPQQLGFRPDASTSTANSAQNLFQLGGAFNNGTQTNGAATPDLFNAFDASAQAPRLEPLDLVQASYGAPFVSASEYDWLFDPTGGFDISFPPSRPASPFGTGQNGGALGGHQVVPQMDFAQLNGMTLPGMHNLQVNSGMSPSISKQFEDATRDLAYGSVGSSNGFSPLPNQWSAMHQQSPQSIQQSPMTDSSAVSPQNISQLPGNVQPPPAPAPPPPPQQQQQQQHSIFPQNQPQESHFVPPPLPHQGRSQSMSDLPSSSAHRQSFSAAPTQATPAPIPPPLPMTSPIAHKSALPQKGLPPPQPEPSPRRKEKMKASEGLLPTASTSTAQALAPAAPAPKIQIGGQDKETQTPPANEIATPAAIATEPEVQDVDMQQAVAEEDERKAADKAASSRQDEKEKADPSVYIDNKARLRIIDYMGHEWKHLRSDVRMSRSAIMEYLELFYSKVHETQAPAVHRASFRACSAPTPLLLSMMLLGCYFASDGAYKLAGQIHPAFRGKVLCSADFRPRRDIWLHQTILLLIIFGKLCSSRMDHEMAHIFWSSCVTLGRRSAIFSQRPPATIEAPETLDAQWAAWIEEEVAKRVALIIFGVDVEHAAFFRHSPTLSAFQIQLQLPCDEDMWEARDAKEWSRLRASARPALPFISALKAGLMSSGTPPPLNPYSIIAILHGLLSVAQDLQWRDHVIGISPPEGRANNWRDMISASYNKWKQSLDECLSSSHTQTSQLLRASISLYAVAHITLSIDIHELQIYAGAQSALGLVVSGAIYSATEARIKLWAQTKDARAATWHAAFFLRSSLQHFQHSNVDLAGCLHHRWSVFIACLTLYCYGRSTSGDPGPPSPDSVYKTKARAYLDSMCTDSPELLANVQNRNESLDLCRVVYEYVENSRWEIAREGSRVLKKLLIKNPCAPSG